MDLTRVGAVFRAVRLRKKWRQVDVAGPTDLSRATISRIERGHLDEVAVGSLLDIARVLEIDVDVNARWHGGELDRLLNARHSMLHEAVARSFADLPGWTLAPEVSFSIYGERGIIDLLAWHAESRCLLVIELKTEIVDVNDLMGTTDRYRRLARQIATERGWDPTAVSLWVIVAAGRTNERRVAAHATTLRAAYPGDGSTMRQWLRAPGGAVRALSFWTDARGVIADGGLATPRRIASRRAAGG